MPLGSVREDGAYLTGDRDVGSDADWWGAHPDGQGSWTQNGNGSKPPDAEQLESDSGCCSALSRALQHEHLLLAALRPLGAAARDRPQSWRCGCPALDTLLRRRLFLIGSLAVASASCGALLMTGLPWRSEDRGLAASEGTFSSWVLSLARAALSALCGSFLPRLAGLPGGLLYRCLSGGRAGTPVQEVGYVDDPMLSEFPTGYPGAVLEGIEFVPTPEDSEEEDEDHDVEENGKNHGEEDAVVKGGPGLAGGEGRMTAASGPNAAAEWMGRGLVRTFESLAPSKRNDAVVGAEQQEVGILTRPGSDGTTTFGSSSSSSAPCPMVWGQPASGTLSTSMRDGMPAPSERTPPPPPVAGPREASRPPPPLPSGPGHGGVATLAGSGNGRLLNAFAPRSPAPRIPVPKMPGNVEDEDASSPTEIRSPTLKDSSGARPSPVFGRGGTGGGHQQRPISSMSNFSHPRSESQMSGAAYSHVSSRSTVSILSLTRSPLNLRGKADLEAIQRRYIDSLTARQPVEADNRLDLADLEYDEAAPPSVRTRQWTPSSARQLAECCEDTSSVLLILGSGLYLGLGGLFGAEGGQEELRGSWPGEVAASWVLLCVLDVLRVAGGLLRRRLRRRLTSRRPLRPISADSRGGGEEDSSGSLGEAATTAFEPDPGLHRQAPPLFSDSKAQNVAGMMARKSEEMRRKSPPARRA